MDDDFTENSFRIPGGSEAEYYVLDYFTRPIIVDGPIGCDGCRYYVDAIDSDYVERVVQGVVLVNQLLLVASHDNPHRVGKLWGVNAVFIPPRHVKYPKVLPPNTTFKQMISGLQEKVLEELHADLAQVDNCPNFTLPHPQQLEAELSYDWKAIPADLFEYGYESSEGFLQFLENAKFSIPPGCEASYFVRDRLFRAVSVDGPTGAWGCCYFVDHHHHHHHHHHHYKEKVFLGVLRIRKGGVMVFASNDEPYGVPKQGLGTVIVLPPLVYKYPKVLPPDTTYKLMMLQVHKQGYEALRADLAKFCPNLSVPDDSQQGLEAQYTEEVWEEMRVADGYPPENEESDLSLSFDFCTNLARL